MLHSRTSDPDHPSAEYLEIYEKILKNTKKLRWNGTRESLPKVNSRREMKTVYPVYEKLCRGETRMVTLKIIIQKEKNVDLWKWEPEKLWNWEPEKPRSDPHEAFYERMFLETERCHETALLFATWLAVLVLGAGQSGKDWIPTRRRHLQTDCVRCRGRVSHRYRRHSCKLQFFGVFCVTQIQSVRIVRVSLFLKSFFSWQEH